MKTVLTCFLICCYTLTHCQQTSVVSLPVNTYYLDADYKGEIAHIAFLEKDTVLFFTKFGYVILGKIENEELNVYKSISFDELVLIDKVQQINAHTFFFMNSDGVFKFDAISFFLEKIEIPLDDILLYKEEDNGNKTCVIKSNKNEIALYNYKNNNWSLKKRYKLTSGIFDVYLEKDKLIYIDRSGEVCIYHLKNKKVIFKKNVGLFHYVDFSPNEMVILQQDKLLRVGYNGVITEQETSYDAMSAVFSNNGTNILLGKSFKNFEILKRNGGKKYEYGKTPIIQAEEQKQTKFYLKKDTGSIVKIDLGNYVEIRKERKYSVLAISSSDDLLIEANSKNELTSSDIKDTLWKIKHSTLVGFDKISRYVATPPPADLIWELEYSPNTNYVVYSSETRMKYWNLKNNRQRLIVDGYGTDFMNLIDDGSILFYKKNDVVEYSTVASSLRKKSNYKSLFKYDDSVTRESINRAYSTNKYIFSSQQKLLATIENGKILIWNIAKQKVLNKINQFDAKHIKFTDKEELLIIDKTNTAYLFNLKTNSYETSKMKVPANFLKMEANISTFTIAFMSRNTVELWKKEGTDYVFKKRLKAERGQRFNDISMNNQDLFIASGLYNTEEILEKINLKYTNNFTERYYVSYLKEHPNKPYVILTTSNGMIKFFLLEE